MKLLFVLAFLLYFSIASALKCYLCASKESMSNCDSGRTEVECVAGADRCSHASVDFTAADIETKVYTKGCSTEALCDYGSDAFKHCKKIDGATCELDCCSGNLCNGGTTPVVSVFLTVACALVALFR